MTKTEAAEMLSLPISANMDDARARFQELYSDYHIRLTNAPTATLKRAYQRNLEELRTACETLFPGMVIATPQDLPASEPVRGSQPEPSISQRTDGARQPAEPARPKPKDSTPFSWGFNLAVATAAVLGAVALLFAVMWSQERDRQRQLSAFLNTPPADQLQFLEKDINRDYAPQLRESLTLLQNGHLEICNDSAGPITIGWLVSNYRGDDGKFHSFNSTAYDWHSWTIPPGGYKQPMTLVKQSSTIWDGSMITFSLGVSYQSQDYVFSGAWSSLKDGCFHLRM